MPPFELDNKDNVVDNKNPNMSPPPYQTVVVDTNHKKFGDLLTHVEGYKWVLEEYYSQMLGMDDDTEALSINRLEIYQQYLKILNFEMRVSAPLDPQQDDVSREFKLTGTSTLYPGFIPNKSDMFTARIGDGRKMLFVIETVEAKSVLLNTTYEISYSSVDYMTPEYEEAIAGKVVKTMHYVKDFQILGKSSFLVDSEYAAYQQLRDWEAKLPLEFIREFYDSEYSTLLVPEQKESAYDPFHTKFTKSVMATFTDPRWDRVREINVDVSNDKNYTFLYDVLNQMNERGLDFVEQFFVFLSARSRHRLTEYRNIRHSGIQYVYYPKGNEELGVEDDTMTLTPSAPRVFNRPIDLNIIIADTRLEGLTSPDIISVPSIKLVTEDSYYVLSEAFYKTVYDDMSALELLIMAVLNKKAICIGTLLQLCEKSVYWGKLERFYYLPLLQYLIIAAKKDVH